MASDFTQGELEAIRERATALARDEQDSGRRAALQLLAEAAENLAVKVGPKPARRR